MTLFMDNLLNRNPMLQMLAKAAFQKNTFTDDHTQYYELLMALVGEISEVLNALVTKVRDMNNFLSEEIPRLRNAVAAEHEHEEYAFVEHSHDTSQTHSEYALVNHSHDTSHNHDDRYS